MFRKIKAWHKATFDPPVKIDTSEGERQIKIYVSPNVFHSVNFDTRQEFYYGLVADCPYVMGSQQFDEANEYYGKNYVETLLEDIQQLNLDSFYTDYFDTMDFRQTPGYFCAHLYGENNYQIFRTILRYDGPRIEKLFYGLEAPIDGWKEKIVSYNSEFVKYPEPPEEFEFENSGIALIGRSVEGLPIIVCPIERKEWLLDYVTSFIRRVGKEYVFANFAKGE